MSNFYDSIQNVSPGKFQKVDFKSKEAWYLEPIDKSILDSLSNEIKSTLAEISLLDSLLRYTTSQSDSILLLSEKANLINSLKYLNLELGAVVQGIKNIQQSKINLVLTENGLLPSTEVYEQNEKNINEIYLNTIAKGIFDFTQYQISLIAEIANQCPLAGGNAVYQARSMYALFHDTIYDDKLLCYLAGIKSNPVEKPNQNADQIFKLFPNPATENVTIEWQNRSDELVTVDFLTPLGQVYHHENISLSQGMHSVSLHNWKSGIYQVCISYSNNKKVYCNKLIIIK